MTPGRGVRDQAERRGHPRGRGIKSKVSELEQGKEDMQAGAARHGEQGRKPGEEGTHVGVGLLQGVGG